FRISGSRTPATLWPVCPAAGGGGSWDAASPGRRIPPPRFVHLPGPDRQVFAKIAHVSDQTIAEIELDPSRIPEANVVWLEPSASNRWIEALTSGSRRYCRQPTPTNGLRI